MVFPFWGFHVKYLLPLFSFLVLCLRTIDLFFAPQYIYEKPVLADYDLNWKFEKDEIDTKIETKIETKMEIKFEMEINEDQTEEVEQEGKMEEVELKTECQSKTKEEQTEEIELEVKVEESPKQELEVHEVESKGLP